MRSFLIAVPVAGALASRPRRSTTFNLLRIARAEEAAAASEKKD